MKTILNTLALGLVLSAMPAFAQSDAPPAVAPAPAAPSAPSKPSKKEMHKKWKQAKKDCLKENSNLKGKALRECAKGKVESK